MRELTERLSILVFNDWPKLVLGRLTFMEIAPGCNWRGLSLFAGIVACCLVGEAQGVEPTITQSQTSTGVKFFYLGDLPSEPSPTLFFLAADGDSALRDPSFLQCGAELQKAGYFCVSIELPGHGAERRDGEPEGLAAWRVRIDAGENPLKELNARITSVIDHLATANYTDPARLGVCGVSRGGFAALHASAADARLRCVVLYSPVTSLSALLEFQDIEQTKLLRELDLANIIDSLRERDIWLTIGDHDERVDTDAAVQFARRLSDASAIRKAPGRIELRVCPAEGHTTPAGAAQESSKWVRRRLD
jgi:dienelactone hydrolase